MKMNDIVNEVSPATAAKLSKHGGQLWRGIKNTASNVVDYATKPRGYTDDAAKAVSAADQQIADLAAQKAALSPRATSSSGKIGDKIASIEKAKPSPTEFTVGQKGLRAVPGAAKKGLTATALPVAGIAGYDTYYGDPEGKTDAERKPAATATGDFINQMAGTYKTAGKHAVAGADKGPQYQLPPQVSNSGQEDLPPPPAKESTKENVMSKTKESADFSDMLKLAGLRAITERDNIAGIIQPKAIQTLTESTSLAECGMGMGMSQPTSATFNISATASSGDEVANMLTQIMNLAGVKPVSQDMMPTHDADPILKSLDILNATPMEPSEPDSMNADDSDAVELDYEPEGPGEDEGKVTVRNVDTGEEHVGRDVTKPGGITVKNVDTGEVFSGKQATDEEYENTPGDPNDVPEWDPNKMVFRPNQSGQGNRMDGTMPKGNPTMQESTDTVTTDLFKAYEAFKSGN